MHRPAPRLVSARAADLEDADEPSGTRRVRAAVTATEFHAAFERFVRSPRESDAVLLRIAARGFSHVEERWGMRRADALRAELLTRTLDAVGPRALTGTLGTDELAILVPLFPAMPPLEEQLEKLRKALDVRDDDGSEVVVHVGGAPFDRDMRDPAEISLRARMALQRAAAPESDVLRSTMRSSTPSWMAEPACSTTSVEALPRASSRCTINPFAIWKAAHAASKH